VVTAADPRRDPVKLRHRESMGECLVGGDQYRIRVTMGE
jgi:hypothetical protein